MIDAGASKAACKACQEELPKGARFCPSCGVRVLPGGEAAPTRRLERRHLTVMFSDIVGSTRLSAALDPEAFHDVIRSYQTTCASEIARHEGYVAQYLGDGILAFFGHPVAHEDDAARAVRAGLGVLARLHELNERVQAAHGVHLSVRLAVHSGLIVLDSEREGPEDASALGHNMNLAARMQEAAAPDTLVVSDATRRLIEGRFEVEAPTVHALKGVDRPVHVCRVLREEPRRIDRDGGRLTPFVNRERETALLLERLERARGGGGGQLVLIRGEPGMGKSRLVRVVYDSAASTTRWIEARCSAYHEHSVLYPIVQLLEEQLRWSRSDLPGSLERLEDACRESGIDPHEYVPLVAELLSFPLPETYAPMRLTAEMKRERTFELLCQWLLARGRAGPVVFLMEDLHWADASTRALLERLALRLQESPLLVLLTARREFEPTWQGTERELRIELGPLDRSSAEELVARLAEGRTLSRDAVAALLTKTDGVPLFLEEMTREALEVGQGVIGSPRSFGIGETEIPQTLQDSLMAQLDRIGRPRSLAQLASAIGREFSLEMLRAILPEDSDDLDQMIARLVEAGIFVRAEDPSGARYSFRHALVRDAAYESMLRARRRTLHERIALTLTTWFPAIAAAQPEVVAHHFSVAGSVSDAITYLGRAGELALARCAYQEATHHLERGLELIQQLSDPLEGMRRELKLRTTLGTVYFSSQGYGVDVVQSTFERARTLFQELGEEVSLEVLNGLWSYNFVRCNADAAADLLPHFQRLIGAGDPASRVAGHAVVGLYSFYTGDFVRALELLEAALPYYDTAEYRSFVEKYGYDAGIEVFGFCSIIQWVLGYPERAARSCAALEAAAARVANPQSQATALLWRLELARSCGEVDVASDVTQRILALAQAQRMPLYLAVGTLMEGWVRSERGEFDAGLERIEMALGIYELAGIVTSYNFYQSLRAEAQLAAGRIDAAVRTIERASKTCDLPLMRYNRPNVLRVQGRLLHQCGDPDGAVRALRESIEVAKPLGARALELEAALIWAQIERGAGTRGAGHLELARVYASFDEGFATRPLQRAAALLA